MTERSGTGEEGRRNRPRARVRVSNGVERRGRDDVAKSLARIESASRSIAVTLPEIRILSIRQPWAWLITSGHKKIENRTWSTRYRGLMLVHAGRRWDDEPIEKIEHRFGIAVPRDLPCRGIVGIAGLCDVITRSNDPYFRGPYGFVLIGACHLPYVPMPGALGLRPAPAALIASIPSAIVNTVRAAVDAELRSSACPKGVNVSA